MFRRSTKATALLLAAASVLSVVPATAATRLGTKEGTIENAVSFKDGKYLFQGYRTDDDDNGLYYNSGDKDKMIDDADELKTVFGKKYAQVFDGNDEYVIDLETGKISDEDVLTDLESTVTTKLTNKLNKTERYENVSDLEVTPVSVGKFEDEYYMFKATKNGKNLFGYTNAAGKYVDCSYDLNLYVYTTSSSTTADKVDGKMQKIEDIEDTFKVYDAADVADKSANDIKVTDVALEKYLGQDSKYIYSLVKVTIENTSDILENDNKEADAFQANKERYYVQRVSKEQGDKEKDAYKPKSTDMFEVSADMGNGDVKTAYEELKKANVKTRIVDGVLYATRWDDDKVKTFKIVLRTSEKLDTYNAAGKKTGTKVSGRVAKKDDDVDTDATDWTIDANGTVWALYQGKIQKSVKAGDFETVYTCDRSLNTLNVYDEKNLIAWDTDGDVYTTVNEGSEAAKEEAEDILGEDKAEDTTTTVKTGWDQLADGTWNLYDATGAKVTGWANVGGVWYYMDKTTAVMKTGWVNDNGTWYYCNASGAMQTGWLLDGSTWYYLQSNGAMKTGWFQDTDGRWYYLNANGSMAANTSVDGYKLGANGAWIR